MRSDDKRLIEVAFPLKQVSLDRVHEKNVRHGHISTLHIRPARRIAAILLLQAALDANYRAVKADSYTWGAE
ncbi:unnamed protein product [marine sediment metagenome]|uniref:DUF1156 domain-containing protein n=1 Tax=marine sediment metagenome TaxID=412755 RepID=X1EH02_9ZZZZ